jgi:cyclic pyranopterin phosphate synthase
MKSSGTEGFTHLDEQGQLHMVDVGDKPVTQRQAVAVSRITLGAKVYERLLQGRLAKGDALAAARVAAIMAVKNTSQLIPLCHPLPISQVAVDFTPDPATYSLNIEVQVKTQAQTGVEMEALTGAAVAALTIYDMCKALDRGMVISDIFLKHKSGGKSGDYHREAPSPG